MGPGGARWYVPFTCGSRDGLNFPLSLTCYTKHPKIYKPILGYILNMHHVAALFLYERTLDSLLLDAIRAINDPDTPLVISKAAEAFVEQQFRAFLILYQNGGIELPYGLRPDTFSS